MQELKVKLLRGNAKLPYKEKDEDACFDVYACLGADMHVLPGNTMRIPLGFAMQLPSKQYQAKLIGRSGLTSKGTHIEMGTVDYGYRGELMAMLHNTLPHELIIKDGMKIAQLDIQKVYEFEVVTVDELDASERGENGFGSTGV